jgi:ribosomal protein S12 methylthiotransferase accessory factor YcaO
VTATLDFVFHDWCARPTERRISCERPFFDPKTGRPNVWYSRGESGALEFFNGPGFHPRTGKALTEITQEFAEKRLDDIARARQEQADAMARAKQEQADAMARRPCFF